MGEIVLLIILYMVGVPISYVFYGRYMVKFNRSIISHWKPSRWFVVSKIFASLESWIGVLATFLMSVGMLNEWKYLCNKNSKL